MFWHQNQGSSIWGSRDIKRFRTRHTYYKMTKKIFFGFVRNQGVMKRGRGLPDFPFAELLLKNFKF